MFLDQEQRQTQLIYQAASELLHQQMLEQGARRRRFALVGAGVEIAATTGTASRAQRRRVVSRARGGWSGSTLHG
eukprot:4407559-Pleurochrysis_carterae.AAC.1